MRFGSGSGSGSLVVTMTVDGKETIRVPTGGVPAAVAVLTMNLLAKSAAVETYGDEVQRMRAVGPLPEAVSVVDGHVIFRGGPAGATTTSDGDVGERDVAGVGDHERVDDRLTDGGERGLTRRLDDADARWLIGGHQDGRRLRRDRSASGCRASGDRRVGDRAQVDVRRRRRVLSGADHRRRRAGAVGGQQCARARDGQRRAPGRQERVVDDDVVQRDVARVAHGERLDDQFADLDDLRLVCRLQDGQTRTLPRGHDG